MRGLKELLFSSLAFLLSCNGWESSQESVCVTCNTIGHRIVIFLNPPIKENAVLELYFENKKILEVNCRILSDSMSERTDDTAQRFWEPSNSCSGEPIGKIHDKYSNINKFELINTSNYPSFPTYDKNSDHIELKEFQNKEIEVILKNNINELLGKQKFKIDFMAQSSICGLQSYPNCSKAEITLNLTAPDAETNNQEGAQ